MRKLGVPTSYDGGDDGLENLRIEEVKGNRMR